MSGPEKLRSGSLRLSLDQRHALAAHLQDADIPEDVRMEIMGHSPAPGAEPPAYHLCKECGTERACPLCDERICVLCGFPLLGSFGCDPRPLAFTGRCCHQCDILELLPFRGGLLGAQAEEFAGNYRASLKKLAKEQGQP